MTDRSNFYKDFSINYRKLEYEKFRKDINEPISKYEYQLEKLIDEIPIWETHFNEKQVNITNLFLNVKNASLVDEYLKLSKGTSWHTLFGESGKGGVLGKLKNVSLKLNKLNKEK